MARVTQKDLEGIVRLINQFAGTPEAPYLPGDDGRLVPQAHCYHLERAYGGTRLVQMTPHGTGVRDVTGRHSTGALYHILHAFKDGLLAVRHG